ncbi:MAG: porin family protein [Flavihumibacter sp.]|nr:porin family protein [Flavihumibacter sp.]
MLNNRLITSMITCCCLIVTIQATAQGSDSLPAPVNSFLFEKDLRFFTPHAGLLPVSPVQQFNRVELSYDAERGDYKLSQAAANSKSIRFITEGVKQIKQFRVSGHFKYLRHIADSVGNTMLYKPEGELFQPYYFFAQKKGNWDKHQYDLQGNLSYAIPGTNLFPYLQVSYVNDVATRSNDPRPSNTGFALNGILGIGYQFSEKHYLAAGYLLGKKVNESSITYKNDAFQQSNLFPEYNNFLLMGYGFYRSWRTNQSMYHTVQQSGFQGQYRGQFSFGEIALEGQWELASSSYTRRATSITSAEIRYGSDGQDLLQVKARWSHRFGPVQARLLADYQSMLVRDFNPLLNSNNYVGSWESIRLQPIVGWEHKNRLKAEMLLNAELSNRYKADGNTDHAVNNQFANLSMAPAFYVYGGKKSIWRMEVNFGYRWAVSGEWIIPDAQQTMFTKNVVLPDFDYFNSNITELGASLSWQGKMKKNGIYSKLGFYQQSTASKANRQFLSLRLGLII